MNILILCTGNSCRSQMADGFFKREMPGANIYSAGVETHGLNPRAVKVMSESGIDISSNTSNHFEDYNSVDFDFVITVCDHAAEVCPVYPKKTRMVHQSFRDPAKAKGTEEDILDQFRKVRDEIESYATDFAKLYQ